jgi:hypothetical protein
LDAEFENIIRTFSVASAGGILMFFRFPPDARWNLAHSAVDFGIGVGEYEGVVRVPRCVFQTLLSEAPRLNAASKPTIFTERGSN